MMSRWANVNASDRSLAGAAALRHLPDSSNVKDILWIMAEVEVTRP